MIKQIPFKTLLFVVLLFCLVLTVACKENNTAEQPSSKDETDIPAESSIDTGNEESKETDISSEETDNGIIKKITGASDENGIYTIVITLNDNISEKGIVEMVYYGAKGTPQENSVVNTFRIEYYKDTTGKYEISTFFDGDVYQNYHQKDEVNVNNTFSASLRAGKVVISYTPEGGETQEIYSAEAERFYVPTT